MNKISGANAMAYWYDPVAGAVTLIGTFGTIGTHDFTSPGDALALILDDASLGFKPPGSSDAVYGPRQEPHPSRRRPLPHRKDNAPR
jgi:hypothetical protein